MVGSSRPLSLGAKLELDDFRPSGFDFMRLILALSVLVPHAATIAQGEAFGEEFFNGPFAPYFQLVLPAFFILSGFLVSGSMFRSKTLVMFAGLRFIRIYPALVVEVILSAFIVGPLVTILPLREYFTDPLFFRYLVNATGHITYYLPGVFVNNPKPLIVNWQLWTVPWELLCYVSISILIVLGVKRRRILVFPALGLLLFYCVFAEVIRPAMAGANPFGPLVGHVSGRELIVCFLLGVALFLYKDDIPGTGASSSPPSFSPFFSRRSSRSGIMSASSSRPTRRSFSACAIPSAARSSGSATIPMASISTATSSSSSLRTCCRSPASGI